MGLTASRPLPATTEDGQGAWVQGLGAELCAERGGQELYSDELSDCDAGAGIQGLGFQVGEYDWAEE